MIRLFFMVMILIGCADNTYREFNTDTNEKADCYITYGAERGYCDMEIKQ